MYNSVEHYYKKVIINLGILVLDVSNRKIVFFSQNAATFSPPKKMKRFSPGIIKMA